MIFEDLHWIDEETQAALNVPAEGIATSRILMLVNYRPEYIHQWGNKTYYTQLRLHPLGHESAEELLDALLTCCRACGPVRRREPGEVACRHSCRRAGEGRPPCP